MEKIKLTIDEGGAVVENEANMEVDESASEVSEPKSCVLDRPFWVVMREKEKHPYFVAYITHPTDKP